jgi:hypothetical protein
LGRISASDTLTPPTHIDSVDPSAEHSGTPDSWTVPTSGRPARRTIVQGAAWTIPVVAASVATPAFAASTPLALAFDAPAYTFAACTTRPRSWRRRRR